MDGQLTQKQLVGVVIFVLGAIWLLAIATITMFRERPVRIPRAIYAILSFVSAMLAGMGGMLFAEDLRAGGSSSAGDYQGYVAAGGASAVFLIVLFFFFKANEKKLHDFSVTANIPATYTFEQAVMGIAGLANATVRLNGFTPSELSAVMGRVASIVAPDWTAALEQLNQFKPASVRSFTAAYDERQNIYTLAAK